MQSPTRAILRAAPGEVGRVLRRNLKRDLWADQQVRAGSKTTDVENELYLRNPLRSHDDSCGQVARKDDGPTTARYAGQVLRFTALVLSSFLACGAPSRLELEGAAPVDPMFRVTPPAPAAEPALPRLTPCPAGWRTVEGPADSCEPWPATGQSSCSGEAAHFPGNTGCERLGETCPADGWPTRLPPGRTVVFVRAMATGGVGTRAQPFATLQQALAANGRGAVIALAPGRYEAATQPLPPNTALVGACAGQTTLTLSDSNPSSTTVLSNGDGVELRQLTVTGTGVGVAAAGALARLTLEDVIIDAATGVGLRLEGGARATGQRVVIRGTVPRADGTLGVGVQVVDGSQLELSAALITGHSSVGVFAYGANSAISLSQTLVGANRGTGVWSNEGSTVTLTASVVEGNRNTGVFAATRSTAHLTDVVVRRTAVAGGGTGQNVWVDGATLRANRLRLEDASALGLGAQNAAVVEVEDLLAQRDFGVGANAGARITLTRALMNETTGVAFNSRLPGSNVELIDTTVVDPRPGPGVMTGGGVSVIRGAALEATRLRVTRAKGVAVAVQSAGSRLALTDARIEDTGPGSDGEGGFPITATGGASLTASRVRIRLGFNVGVYVLEPGTAAEVTDLHVEAIMPPASQGGLYGNGIVVAAGARLTGSRVRVAEVHDTGVLADGATLTLADATILGASLTCPDNPDCAQRVAVGLSSQVGARVSMSRFSIGSNGGIGAQVADTAQLDLADGWVGFHQIGANVMPAAYDLTRLDRSVSWVRNAQKLAAKVLPLPKLAPPPP